MAPVRCVGRFAGRDCDRLARVRESLAEGSATSAPGIIVASFEDPGSLLRMAERSRVVVSTVGPFLRHGAALVNACVDAETDYVDSTGETPFVRDLVDACDARSRKRSVMIVPCCGFDSVPADLGCFSCTRRHKSKVVVLQACRPLCG